MGDNVDSGTKTRSQLSRRKPYRTPRLERLGTLTEITADVGSNGMNDQGHGKTKTS